MKLKPTLDQDGFILTWTTDGTQDLKICNMSAAEVISCLEYTKFNQLMKSYNMQKEGQP